MIGVWLTKRRDEFSAFVRHHVLLFEDIYDPTDIAALQKYESILTDDTNLVVVNTKIVFAKDESFEELLQPFVLYTQDINSIASSCLYAAFDKVQQSLAVTLTFPPQVIQTEEVLSQSLNMPEYSSLISSTHQESEPVGNLDQIIQEPSPVPEEVHVVGVSLIKNTESQTQIFGMPPMPTVNNSRTGGIISRNENIQKMAVRGVGKKRFGAAVIAFSSLTDKAGVSSVSFMFAKALALQSPEKRILYLDLNISNPNSILNLLQLNTDTDASIVKIATTSEIDFINNISLLTETVPVSDCSMSLITFGEATLMQKSQLIQMDFGQLLIALADCFDTVVVDLGRFLPTAPYQQKVFEMSRVKTIMVADGSTSRVVTSFIKQVKELPFHFDVIVNKYTPSVGTFTFTKELAIAPPETVTAHRNMEALISERIPFEGTALQVQLNKIGDII